jgi:glycosyltransferase involved in cell wall biosynthesis
LYIRWHYLILPTLLWARIRRVPVVQEVNGTYEDLFIAHPWTRKLAWLLRRLGKSSLRFADAIITVTPELKRWIEGQVDGRPVYNIPNGANAQLFRPGVAEDVGLPRPYALFFGVLAAWQGLEVLLSAVDDPQWPAEVTLVVVGDGAERARVEAAAATSSRVKYLGKLPYRRMPGIIASSLVGISPQTDLGGRAITGLSPIKVYETLSAGVPVIVSDFPGQAELVREWECGIVFTPGDAAALARAVAQLNSNLASRDQMGRRGRQAIEHEHSWAKRALDTSAVLNRVLGFAPADQ